MTDHPFTRRRLRHVEPDSLTAFHLREFRRELAALNDDLDRHRAWQEAEIERLHKRLEELEGLLRMTLPKHKIQPALHKLQRDIDGLRDMPASTSG